MAAPSGAKLRQDLVIAEERVTDNESLGIVVVGWLGRVFGPEVEEAMGGSNWVVRAEREEGEREAEPVIERCVENVEGRGGRSAGVRVAVGGAECEEGERRLVSGD